jgi:acetolactate synthase-1/3 small subunit
LTGSGFTSRELMLLKVKSSSNKRNDVMAIVNIFEASVCHVDHEAMIVEVTGASEKLDSFAELMSPFGIIEMARTGKVALARSPKPTEDLDMIAGKLDGEG